MFRFALFSLLSAPRLTFAAYSSCTSSTFAGLSLPGGKILNVTTTQISNYSATSAEDVSANHFAENVTNLDACEVAIQYTHPGQNDVINVMVWLPSNWTGRFMGVGGGGWVTGYGRPSLAWPASKGFAAGSTDGGHSASGDGSVSPDSWALVSPGNVDWALLQDFAAIALDDMTTLGKEAARLFYDQKSKYSYWNGCSTGGRQGLMMAQRYGNQYEGILAAAPAINWEKFLGAEYYPQLVMNELGMYPSQCELEAFTAAAISACDSIDGVKDGIIVDPNSCTFDPDTVVGQISNCSTGQSVTLSKAGATVAKAAWTGAQDGLGKQLWYGLTHEAPLYGLANTTCSANGTCTGVPFSIPVDWIRLFVEKNPDFNVKNLTRDGLAQVIRQSANQYKSIMGTNDPDLTDFKNAGGKMITWHGLADQVIFPNGTFDYYDKVRAADESVADYYRVFAAPGIYHCSGGPGWFPGDALTNLIEWVEQGKAPETLEARSTVGTDRVVDLCAYPKRLVYKGGDTNTAEAYDCED